ncbi:glycosyltransferase [Candidatus Dojkabacteria bacterium]|uniref:Glycosyltransferase n=1 Tax=Candidatus Dojkabacteria bacterium TaxID=2099670 RepID=A0A955L7A0_9BACT|nr:glycosyltransferase [Candidatus Dojkabacteria bacterium]
MKIAIDITSILDQYAHRGIGTYTKQIVRILIQNPHITWHLIGFSSRKVNFATLALQDTNFSHVQFHSIGPVVPSGIFNRKHSKKHILPLLEIIRPDIYFAPHFERGIFKGSWKNIVMIHDLIPIETRIYSQKSSFHNIVKGLFYNYQLKKVLQNSDHFIVNSETTKASLIHHFPQIKNTITVSPLGISPHMIKLDHDPTTCDRILRSYGISDDYILYYGGLEGNKNVDTLITGFSQSSTRESKNISLVIVSNEFKRKIDGTVIPQTAQAKKVYTLVKDLRLAHSIVFTGYVEENDMSTLLSQSKLFCHISEQEGFGLSVLEALSHGVPSIISNIPVYRELFTEGALFVTPQDPTMIAKEIDRLLNNSDLYEELSSHSHYYKTTYTWKATADKTLEVFSTITAPSNKQTRSSQKELKNDYDITFLIPHFFPFKGGAENYTLDIAKNLAKEGKKVAILTSQYDSSLPLKERYLGIDIFRSRLQIGGYYTKTYLGLLLLIMKIKTRNIHAQGFGFIWQDICLICKRFFGTSSTYFINTPHGPFMARSDYSSFEFFIKSSITKLQRLYLNWLYDKVIMVNPHQHEWIHSDYKISRNKIKFLPIGVSPSTSNQIIPQTDRIHISYLGRFHEYKGVMTLLKSIKNLTETTTRFHLTMMGMDAGAYDTMRRFIIESELEEFVTILKSPSNSKRDEVLSKSEIFVLPSDWEAYGIAIVEAMSHGNSIITTKTEGGLYLVKNKINGLLVTYENSKELTLALVQLTQNDSLRHDMITTNRELAKSLTWKYVWKEYASLYQ